MLCLLLFLSSFFRPAPPPAPVTIAAAADLQYVLDSLVTVFRRQQPGARVTVVYGSSGKFYQQLVHGAPFDLYFSADSEYPRKLAQQGLTAAPAQPYAIGRLVLWSRKIDPNKLGINALVDPAVKKVAMANPAHAPYGQRAAEVLRHYRLYEQVQPRLVLGENIAQTAQFATTGAADVGILALSLARSPALRRQGHYYLIPAAAHAPLEQSFVVLKRAARNATATAFATFMSSTPARAALRRYGFALPGEEG